MGIRLRGGRTTGCFLAVDLARLVHRLLPELREKRDLKPRGAVDVRWFLSLSGGSGRALSPITPSCPRGWPGMDGRWLECCGIPTAAGMDWERAFFQREKTCREYPWPGPRSGERQEMGVSTHLAQPSLETPLLGLAAPQAGQCCLPRVRHPNPKPWELGCAVPGSPGRRGAPGPGSARQGWAIPARFYSQHFLLSSANV